MLVGSAPPVRIVVPAAAGGNPGSSADRQGVEVAITESMGGSGMAELRDVEMVDGVEVVVADGRHLALSDDISAAIREEVQLGGIGLAERPVTEIRERIRAGDALVALRDGAWVGFCYVRPWEGGKFVSTSALIVRRGQRGRGIARRLKEAALRLCREKHPGAIPFGLSTSESIWSINRRLGFIEVPYARITRDPGFWEACRSCELHSTLLRNRGASCRCRATLLPPGGVLGESRET